MNPGVSGPGDAFFLSHLGSSRIASVGYLRPQDKSHFGVYMFPAQFTSSLLLETKHPALQAKPGGQKSVTSPQATISIHFTLNSYEKTFPPFSFSTNVARLRSRKQKIKVSHDFRTQEKLIKSKFSQNVKS